MITLEELNPKGFALSDVQRRNVVVLHERINIVRKKYGKPMLVTSGVRSIEDHKRIYMEIAKRKGISNPRIPMGSQHLKGAAVDISDPKGELYAWCKANESVLIEAKLWCEEGTRGWVHFQIVPPASGKRWFLP